LRKELTRLAARDELDQLAIFMSSATDPYQGAERQWRLSRACLDLFQEFPPGLLVIQTRSPLVSDDFARIRALGARCWLNFTLETDLEPVRQTLTPHCPSIAQRLAAIQAAIAFGLQVQITVSPCLPYSSVETFGQQLLAQNCRVIVDSFVSGDGQAGKRTAATATGARYAEQAWGDWRSEERARALYEWLEIRLGERVGWSQAGFTALTQHQ
jgi:DNA repair photolyase